jgi:hypothetical protein
MSIKGTLFMKCPILFVQQSMHCAECMGMMCGLWNGILNQCSILTIATSVNLLAKNTSELMDGAPDTPMKEVFGDGSIIDDPEVNAIFKPSAPVTEETYRRIFTPTLSCEGCFFSWKSKDAFPCLACTRVSQALRYPYDGKLEDRFTKEYKEDFQNPQHFQ